MPIRRRSGGTMDRGEESSSPPTRIAPSSGARKPASRRSVVVLPQPDGPRKRHELLLLDLEAHVLEDVMAAEALVQFPMTMCAIRRLLRHSHVGGDREP